jgi:hypothetical protein
MKYALAGLAVALLASQVLAAEPADKADPDATRLLAEAREARATWKDFPGFTADAEVNFDGRLTRARVQVATDGTLTFTLTGTAADGDADRLAWAKQTLGSIVGHRLSAGPAGETPCRFTAADDADHPLGRSVQVLNDEFHSSYRIRDKQIAVVNRQMKGQHFTITVLEQTRNPEGKFLSGHFVVNYWSDKDGALLRSETNHQSWTRVSGVDLPMAARVVTATPEKEKGSGLTARSVVLSNHRLLSKTAATGR